MTTTTVPVTAGGRERVPAAAELYEDAFRIDPVITYLLSSMVPAARLAYLREYFSRLLTAAAMNKAIIHEAGEWGSCGVLMPPGCKVDNPLTMIPAGIFPMLWNIGLQSLKYMLFEYEPLTDLAKKKGLKGEKRFYYVFFIATKEEARGKGLCSAIMRKYQEIGSREGVPVWLEATTEKSMRIYKKSGWEVVDEFILGNGKAGPDGLPCKGGEGVRVWGMVWFPETYQKVEKKGVNSINSSYWLPAAIMLWVSVLLYVYKYVDITDCMRNISKLEIRSCGWIDATR